MNLTPRLVLMIAVCAAAFGGAFWGVVFGGLVLYGAASAYLGR
jgi:hypothetical protein